MRWKLLKIYNLDETHYYIFDHFLHFGLALYAQVDSIKVKGELGLRGQWQTGRLNQFVMNPFGKINIENNRFNLELDVSYRVLFVNDISLKNDL